MHTEHHTVTVIKYAKRNLNADIMTENITGLLNSVNTLALKNQGWSWITTDIDTSGSIYQAVSDDPKYKYVYVAYLACNYEGDATPSKNAIYALANEINTRAKNPAYGAWNGVGELDGSPFTPPTDKDIEGDPTAQVGYEDVEIPEDWAEHFAHLYGLNSHVSRIRKSIEIGLMSGWTKRQHSVLIGPPGCGKSDICESFRRALGENAVFKFDATSTTAAGAIQTLKNLPILPRIILLEEIEKAPEAAMLFLLGILDMRGEIRKVTARDDVQRNVKCVAIATVNDETVFEKMQAGALASRFMNKIYFKRPSRDTLIRILTREVTSINGNQAWVMPTIEYCEREGIYDPRVVINHCLVGGDDWLNGTYEKMLYDTDRDRTEE